MMDIRKRYYKFLSAYHGCYLKPQFTTEYMMLCNLLRYRDELIKRGQRDDIMTECNNLIILLKATM